MCLALALRSVLLLVSAAMLYPALLCAALLLLAPLENTEARALHPSPDSVQVQREGCRDGEGALRVETVRRKKAARGDFRVDENDQRWSRGKESGRE